MMSRVLEVVSLVEKKLPYSWVLDDLAAKISVSKWHLQREFKANTGMSIGQYARTRRLSMAAYEIANTDKRIIDVAMDFDFESQEAFARAFKRQYGISPKHLKLQPTWANNLFTRPICQEYIDCYHYCCANPPSVVNFPDTHFYGLYDYFEAIRFDSDSFLHQLTSLWDKFLSAIPEGDMGAWSDYYSVETFDRGSHQMKKFTMMVARTRSFDPDIESTSFMPAHQRLQFSVPKPELTEYFLEYLYFVYLPQSRRSVMKLPVLWQMDLEGKLSALFALEYADAQVLPKAIESISSGLVHKSNQDVVAIKHDVCIDLRETGLRIKNLLDRWEKDFDTGVDIIVGDYLGKEFEIDHQFTSHFIARKFNVDRNSTSIKVTANDYLRVELVGTVMELAEAVDHILFVYLDESPYYSTVGCEWFSDIKKVHDTYTVTALFPVKKR